MEKQAKIRSLPFLNALSSAQSEYGLNITEDDFIEIGYKVWRTIGNIAPVKTRYFTKVPDDFIIELPPGCEFIDSVTIVQEPKIRTNYDSGGGQTWDLPSMQVESVIPRTDQSITTSPGNSVNYVLEVGAVRITSEDTLHKDVMLVYSSILVGEDGLPLLNDKEVAAVAAEVTRRMTVKDAFGGVSTKKSMLEYITMEASRLMAAAKVDEVISDDGFDKMLNIKTSWDRKVYGHRFNMLN